MQITHVCGAIYFSKVKSFSYAFLMLIFGKKIVKNDIAYSSGTNRTIPYSKMIKKTDPF